MTTIGGVPWIAYAAQSPTSGYSVVRVARVGVTVTYPGNPLNINPARDAGDPSITTIGGVPYVAWAEDVQPGGWREIRVARFTGTSWVQVGASLNVDPTARASHPTITSVNGVPWVAWDEASGEAGFVNVKEFAGGLWEPASSAFNTGTRPGASPSNPSPSPGYPSITTANGTPYVAFVRWTGSVEQLHVAYPLAQRPLAVRGMNAISGGRGVTFVLRLPGRAAVRIDIVRRTTGRVAGGNCVAPTRKNLGEPTCSRSATLGTLRLSGHRGVNRFTFDGRLSSNRRLKPGRYEAEITATSSGGDRSIPSWTTFTLK
jgi:hypothetical protein